MGDDFVIVTPYLVGRNDLVPRLGISSLHEPTASFP